jgi:hypothetical protein
MARFFLKPSMSARQKYVARETGRAIRLKNAMLLKM